MTIKALGDREQCQAIEAGDTIEILRRALPKAARPELLSTVRQETKRDREIANLFRDGEAAKALAMKREDGTALLVEGDYQRVVDRTAELYLERRDQLRIAGHRCGIIIVTLTNDDVAEISRSVRSRLRERGEIAATERVYQAIDQRGETYDLPIAAGDRLRLFRKTWASFDGKGGWMGSNGDIVTVAGETRNGLLLRNSRGQLGEVEWRRMLHAETGRLLLGFGHAYTVDAAQGVTTRETINAMPHGSGGMTAFKAYPAESRAVGTTWTVASKAAIHEAGKRSRALGSSEPITEQDLWNWLAKDMSAKPYKALAIDLQRAARRDREEAIATFIADNCRLEAVSAGRNIGRETRSRLQAQAVRKQMERHIPALEAAIAANAAQLAIVSAAISRHLERMRVEAEQAKSRMQAGAVGSLSPGSS
jgi:hypothetical protein